MLVTVYPASEALAAADARGGWVLELSRGEVLVNVVRKGTAFAVRTAAGEARALGTIYKVSLRQEEGAREMKGYTGVAGAVMMVTVMAGTVQVLAEDKPVAMVTAGESVSVKTALLVPVSPSVIEVSAMFRLTAVVSRIVPTAEPVPIVMPDGLLSVTVKVSSAS